MYVKYREKVRYCVDEDGNRGVIGRFMSIYMTAVDL